MKGMLMKRLEKEQVDKCVYTTITDSDQKDRKAVQEMRIIQRKTRVKEDAKKKDSESEFREDQDAENTWKEDGKEEDGG